MNLSMPARIAIDWIGMSAAMESVAASVMKPTPEAPLEAIMAMPRIGLRRAVRPADLWVTAWSKKD